MPLDSRCALCSADEVACASSRSWTSIARAARFRRACARRSASWRSSCPRTSTACAHSATRPAGCVPRAPAYSPASSSSTASTSVRLAARFPLPICRLPFSATDLLLLQLSLQFSPIVHVLISTVLYLTPTSYTCAVTSRSGLKLDEGEIDDEADSPHGIISHPLHSRRI